VPEVFVVGRRQKLTKTSMRSLLNFHARTFFPETKSDDKLKTLLYLANGNFLTSWYYCSNKYLFNLQIFCILLIQNALLTGLQ